MFIGMNWIAGTMGIEKETHQCGNNQGVCQDPLARSGHGETH